ncbi:uncharacterized protein BXZ73DRAFT_97196 [Epithele typhae]|uniref:uncharacterized protein n=1 Tax=Epithele typhae TaxID=378194 RepID=UPI002008D9DF|nr:uncharacterized protein BXZ73DRAFT_97196 [Epithele typhae]KAH9943142.1 hypothetical protein BXZ73DRAFT_97196 [Epithele typhae]
MSHLPFPEPPTDASVAQALAQLDAFTTDAQALARRIQAARDELAHIVDQRQAAIRGLEHNLATLEDRVALTRAYVSPIRRLPREILVQIFLAVFDDCSWSPWILSAVCTLWRRLALSIPKLWSKIRLVTAHASSAETIRLWLERSGRTVPLDIEIVLCSSSSHHSDGSRRRCVPVATHAPGDVWAPPPGWTTPPPVVHTHGPAAGGAALPLHIGDVHLVPVQAVVADDPPGPTPPSPTHAHAELEMPPLLNADTRTIAPHQRTRKNMHWGHIAFYYLVEQMARWERFVFRFDKQFASIGALRAIGGDAPMLREFEISCSNSEPVLYNDWKWLPSAPASTSYDILALRTLTLQHVPFQWSSPMFRNLHHLTLRSLPTVHISLDRILHIVAANPSLQSLALHFASPNPPVLPLKPVTLPHLKGLNFSGHYLLANLVDVLVLPVLDTLILDIEARDPIEDTLTSLLTRSGNPPITRLSLSYGTHTGPHTGYYWVSGPGVASWHFLSELDSLRALHVGAAPFEPLLGTLGAPDEDNGQDRWVCPRLATLALRGCHAHGDGIAKLVQMVDARNPDGGGPPAFGGVVPTRLRRLELYDCSAVGPDVVEWLRSRIGPDDVVCPEPSSEGYIGRFVLVQ